MANSLNTDLDGKTVIFKNMKPEFADMKFKVTGGFGTSPTTSGTALYGTFEDGEEARMSGYDVRAIVPNDPALDLMVEVTAKIRDEVSKELMSGGRSTTLGAIDALVKERLAAGRY